MLRECASPIWMQRYHTRLPVAQLHWTSVEAHAKSSWTLGWLVVCIWTRQLDHTKVWQLLNCCQLPWRRAPLQAEDLWGHSPPIRPQEESFVGRKTLYRKDTWKMCAKHACAEHICAQHACFEATPVIYSSHTWLVVLIMPFTFFVISIVRNSELVSNNLAVLSDMQHEAIHFPRHYFHFPASIANAADGDDAVPRRHLTDRYRS